MNINDIFQLIQEPEGLRSEFKEELPRNSTDIAELMAAFANTEGGVLLVGVEDKKHTLVGVPNPDEVMLRLTSIARSSCRPPIRPQMDSVAIGNGGHIVWVSIERQADGLCFVEGRCYIRVGPSTHRVEDAHELTRLLQPASARRVDLAFGSIAAPLIQVPRTKGFRGRADELDTLHTRLGDDSTSIAVIEGISGVGKSALAARFSEVATEEGYHSFWLDCHPETTLDLVTFQFSNFARTIGDISLADLIDDVSSHFPSHIQSIATAMAQRRYALFFDDYHAIADSKMDAFLQALEERGGATFVVLTARQRLPVLDVLRPIGVYELRLTSGIDSQSCASFLRDVQLDVDDISAKRIWELAGQGHPKALQLFAARAKSVPIAHLLNSLPTFRTALIEAWLNPLLDELPHDQRTLVFDLCVFDRPLSVQALFQIFPERDIALHTIGLVDRFILDYTRDSRLQMHPLVRDYCYSLLKTTKDRHLAAADFYLGQHEMSSDLGILGDEYIDDLLAGWSHLVKANEHARASEVVAALRTPLANRGNLDQLMYLLENTVPQTEEDEDWSSISRARILSIWGRHDEAQELLEPLLESSNERVVREAVLVMSYVYADSSNASRMLEFLESQAYRFSGPISPRVKLRFVSRAIQANIMLGKSKEALTWATRMLTAAEAGNEPISGAIALRHMATALQSMGNIDMAVSLCLQSVALLDEAGRVGDAAMSRTVLGSLRTDEGKPDEARASYQEAIRAFITAGDRTNASECRRRLAQLSPRSA